ncbi:histidinol-phosphate transaminase [Pseudalkalibacillus caeni]|uniref:Histidinol-phosphate aminotransferase n=1 Tax=Exobacillus caeni TaxID=2574798 RepID=A0A5R9F848_9BACL|nr:histidinol-phosphate transaminase [Pseudalkalibacillus caeni]TLS35905.1 histidinol-phosphate transaminase [Pseudalkalibacillus caeni]
MNAKPQMYDLKPYQPGKPIEEVKRELGLKKVTKLASNENPFGCSPEVKEAVSKELSSLAVYPDGYAARLRETVSEFLGVDGKNLIFGNGSDEIVQILCRAYLSPGKNTVMAAPTFPQYKHNAVIEGAEIREVELDNGKHQLDEMLSAIDKNTEIVWLCTPNNPTGVYIKEADLLPFLNKVPKDVLVVCDEAYAEYVTADDYPDTIALLDKFPNLIILRTFSKAYGLAALRVGYGIANESVIQTIEPAREPFNTSRIAQAAAVAAMGDQEFVQACKKKNQEGLQQFYTFCEEFSLDYYESQGNFILIGFGNKSGDEVFDYLLRQGFIVRSGNALGFPNAVRITVGDKQQNQEIITCLSDWLKN